MNLYLKEFFGVLAKKQIRPTFQRVKVLEHLKKNLCHPTVENIYTDLQAEIPTLSRTTVYNTLDLLVKADLVKQLQIDGNETRYDSITELHGHFKCEKCNSISNFEVAIDQLEFGVLAGYEITDRNVYFKGICPRCLTNIKLTRERRQIDE